MDPGFDSTSLKQVEVSEVSFELSSDNGLTFSGQSTGTILVVFPVKPLFSNLLGRFWGKIKAIAVTCVSA